MRGKVYIAGAGPGDPGLITVKLERLFDQVDVVLYDHLISEALLSKLPDRIEKKYVGKIGFTAVEPAKQQQTIYEEFKKYVDQGKLVLRLKGGDPFVFGRGFEEVQFLEHAGIDFEIIPGLPSIIAGCAYAGLPLTHRGTANSFAVLTGYHQADPNLDQLIIPKVDTLVFVMAMKNLDVIISKCIEQGLLPTTPCMFIEQATTAKQRIVTTTLAYAPAEKEKQTIKAPALLVVGKVAKLGGGQSWFGQLPLFGKRLMVTRPYEQARELINGLEQLGAEVISYATIDIKPLVFRPEVDQMQRCNRIYFTSKHAVDYFFMVLEQMGLDARSCADKKIIAIGAGTSKALKCHGLLPDQVPSIASMQGLIDSLPNHLENHICLLPQAKSASPDLAKGIERRHGQTIIWPLYETISRPWPQLKDDHLDGVIAASPSAIPKDAQDANLHQINLFCIGHTTAVVAKQEGWKLVRVAAEANNDALVKLVKQVLGNQ